jgi:hypothetical protein
MSNNNIKNKSIINLDKLDQAILPKQEIIKDAKKLSTSYKILIFINIVFGLFITVNFALGSFAPDIALLLLGLVIILAYYTKYPF